MVGMGPFRSHPLQDSEKEYPMRVNKGDKVQVSLDGKVWNNATYEKKAMRGIHWVVMPNGEKESFAEPLIKPSQETITKYTKFPPAPKMARPDGPAYLHDGDPSNYGLDPD